jgi:hypothetical protein
METAKWPKGTFFLRDVSLLYGAGGVSTVSEQHPKLVGHAVVGVLASNIQQSSQVWMDNPGD